MTTHTTADAIKADNLSKRYGQTWALRECCFTLVAGRVTALVGPNGAGKTTLLHLAMGLLHPTSGSVHIFGLSPSQQATHVLPLVGFVDQRHPLYPGFTVEEMLTLGRKLNLSWDDTLAHSRLHRLGIPLTRSTGKLSSGQQAQVALVLALAKRPQLLLLDEPLASLDPLARREFMRVLMEEVSEYGLTVVLSSHNLTELERACDYLLILAGAQLQLAGDIEELVATHHLLSGPRATAESIARRYTIIQASHSERQSSLLVRQHPDLRQNFLRDPTWTARNASLEEIVLAYLERTPAQGAIAASSSPSQAMPFLRIVDRAPEEEREA